MNECVLCGWIEQTISDDLLELRPTIFNSVPRLYQRMYSKVMESIQASNCMVRWYVCCRRLVVHSSVCLCLCVCEDTFFLSFSLSLCSFPFFFLSCVVHDVTHLCLFVLFLLPRYFNKAYQCQLDRIRSHLPVDPTYDARVWLACLPACLLVDFRFALFSFFPRPSFLFNELLLLLFSWWLSVFVFCFFFECSDNKQHRCLRRFERRWASISAALPSLLEHPSLHTSPTSSKYFSFSVVWFPAVFRDSCVLCS